MSATPSRPLPTPGLAVLCQVRSCVPKGVFKGDPMSRPWPGMVRQFTPSCRPASAQVEGLIPLFTMAEPGKLRYVAAMLLEGAEESKDEVSPHSLEMVVTDLGVRTVS